MNGKKAKQLRRIMREETGQDPKGTGQHFKEYHTIELPMTASSSIFPIGMGNWTQTLMFVDDTQIADKQRRLYKQFKKEVKSHGM